MIFEIIGLVIGILIFAAGLYYFSIVIGIIVKIIALGL